MTSRVRILLSVMMFLQFYVWGSWYVTLVSYLSNIGFSEAMIGTIYSTTAIAALISPFFVGMVVDKFFPTEKVLAVLHLIGGVLLLVVSRVASPGVFFWILLLYTLCYMPTLALVNTISFHNMREPGEEFPRIRVLGTIGWIIAGWVLSMPKWFGGDNIEPTSIPLQIAGGVSLALGIFCFFLPHTPPKAAGKKVTAREVLGLDALVLMKERSFAVFVISSFLISIPLTFYFQLTHRFLSAEGMEAVAAKMTLGQISEIIFLWVMPFFFVRLGVKRMLIIGMLAWTVRYILFAFGDGQGALVLMFYLGIVLHGVCFDFFFVVGQIYVDKKASVDIRGAAQGFIFLVTYGAGMLIGNLAAGFVAETYATTLANGEMGHNWQMIWLIPTAMAAVVMVAFSLLFHDRVATDEDAGTAQSGEATT